jgi:uncharacterized protein (DUF2235 family)
MRTTFASGFFLVLKHRSCTPRSVSVCLPTVVKNIVICSDGTGNVAIKGRGTNVFKLFEAVDLQVNPADPALIPQIAYYDDGVGTEKFKLLKILSGAFGWGLSRNVRDLYTELTRVYEPGDRIFFFGFSRGAYTVRTLAGLIAQVGIVDRGRLASDSELRSLVKQAYSEHRRCFRRFSRWFHRPVDDTRAAAFRVRHSMQHPTLAPEGKVTMAFVGVWDTVDAVGFPLDEVADFWNDVVYPFKFPDTKLSPLVERACQAIAIDDERQTFHPVMWDEEKEAPGRIEQVWFAGVHSNIGGGYPKQGLSLVSLVWMMEQAERCGLRLLPSVRQMIIELQNVNDKLYDSRSGLSGYYRYKARDIREICRKSHVQPKVHVSVIERIALGTDAYAPGNLPGNLEVVNGDIAAAAAVTQAIRAAGARERPLAEQANRWIQLKEVCQRSFAFLTAVLLLFVIQHVGIANLGDLFSFKILGVALEVLRDQWWLGAAIAGCFGLVVLSTRNMQAIYSEFWFSLRPQLRRLLMQGGKQAAAAGD